jgi:predicted DCC family thiol-disulfide oxidoreductase YuxK
MNETQNLHRPTLIFDGQCPFCRKWVKRLQGILHEVEISFRSLTDLSLQADFPALDQEDLTRSIHFVAADGTVYTGVDAIVEALSLRPAGRLSQALRIPGIKQASDATYRFIAARRYRDEAAREACDHDRCGATR